MNRPSSLCERPWRASSFSFFPLPLLARWFGHSLRSDPRSVSDQACESSVPFISERQVGGVMSSGCSHWPTPRYPFGIRLRQIAPWVLLTRCHRAVPSGTPRYPRIRMRQIAPRVLLTQMFLDLAHPWLASIVNGPRHHGTAC